jgi:hypothetical protein
LPEPTGPPTPIRSGPWDFAMSVALPVVVVKIIAETGHRTL